jgi:hypothetical protein
MALAQPGGRGVRDLGMGRLVQRPAHPRADRKHPARRSRGALLCTGRGHGQDRLAQTK